MEQVDNARRLGVMQLAAWKDALNWFFKASRSSPINLKMANASQRAAPVVRDKEPPLAAWDLGGPEWEQKLIREIRSRHYEWRTEQAYRMWARRFAEWLEKRGGNVLSASEIELQNFLSDLATRQRVALATQRQALNAVVFLVRETLGRPLEDFGGFTRARAVKRLPVVLSRVECQRLLGALEGTMRLMAELMYGSGLRLMELNSTRIPKRPFESSCDASSPQGESDALVATFPSTGYTPHLLATGASPTPFCDGASQPPTGRLRNSRLRMSFPFFQFPSANC